jgi:L,D-transpeptidase YcbB
MKIKHKLIYQSLIITIIIVLQSCAQNGQSSSNSNPITALFETTIINPAQVGSDIITYLQGNSSGFIFQKDSIKNTVQLIALYKNNKNEALWLTKTGLSKNATSLLQQIEKLEEDGLNVSDFKIFYLQELQKKIALKKINANDAMQFDLGLSIASLAASNAIMHGQYIKDTVGEHWFNDTDSFFDAAAHVQNMIVHDSMDYIFETLLPNIDLYKKFKTKLSELKKINKAGGWPLIEGLKDSLQSGMNNANIAILRKRLFIEIGIPKDTASTIVNDDLQTAIHSFQYLHDLKLSGRLDTNTLRRLNITAQQKIANLQNNLERLRWIQKDFPQPYIWVNIPKMELQYIDADSTQFKMRTVVGRTSRPTPTLNALMSNIVINPGWNVPPTIMKEEVVPGVGRRGGSYLSKRGLKAFYHGREVSGDQINEKNYKAFVIQQKPGLNSALGAVKFNLPNRHAIYLHDTPHREDFVKYYRAYSSGCIRVEKPRDFAAFLLNDTNYSKLNIDTFIRKKITKEVPLKKKIEVHIVYLTNGLDSLGNVMYLRDIYGKDAKMGEVWE